MTDLFSQKVQFYGPKLMQQFGLTTEQAAGLIGNLAHESGGFRYMQELGKRPPAGGLGVAQWTATRRQTFEAWCHGHGVSTASDAGNYGYLAYELAGSQKASITALKRCKTVDTAARSFCVVFERPGKVLMAERLSYARKALAILHPGHPAAVAPAPKAKAAPMAKKAKPVRKRAAAVAHVIHKAKHRP